MCVGGGMCVMISVQIIADILFICHSLKNFAHVTGRD